MHALTNHVSNQPFQLLGWGELWVSWVSICSLKNESQGATQSFPTNARCFSLLIFYDHPSIYLHVGLDGFFGSFRFLLGFGGWV